MKLLGSFALQFLTCSLFAQVVVQTNLPPGCGSEKASYTVKKSDDFSVPVPASGKATLVLIEDQIQTRPGHGPCIKCASQVHLGIDGEWVAASEGFSHTAISIEPGEHHLCVESPSSLTPALPSLYGLHAEAGKTYFLRARLIFYYGTYVQTLDLSQLNEDEGRYLVTVTKRSDFTRK